MPQALMVEGRLQDVNPTVRPKHAFVIGCVLAALAVIGLMSGLPSTARATAWVAGAVPRAAPAATSAVSPVKMQVGEGKNLFGQELSDEDKAKVSQAEALREAFMKRNPKVAEKEKEAQMAAGADAKDWLGRPINVDAAQPAPAEEDPAEPEAPAAEEGAEAATE